MIHVLVVDEVRAVGEMIAAVLRSEADIDVVGNATNFDAIRMHLAHCDVVLVNAGKHCEASLPVIRDIRQLNGDVKIVVLGLACTQSFVWQCVEAGIAGYVPQESSLSELLHILRAAYKNEALVSPPIAAVLMSYIAERAESAHVAAPQPELGLLTRREREVLTLIQQGLTNQEIAQSLVIELGTVKNHVHNILRKLNINSRRDTLHLSRSSGVWEWKDRPLGREAPPLRRSDEHAYPRLARAAVHIPSH
jgi:DNA-binding NarL/FixJ family response regulator